VADFGGRVNCVTRSISLYLYNLCLLILICLGCASRSAVSRNSFVSLQFLGLKINVFIQSFPIERKFQSPVCFAAVGKVNIYRVRIQRYNSVHKFKIFWVVKFC
jgi:hypothetical protein